MGIFTEKEEDVKRRMGMEPTTTITQKEYDELKADSELLNELRAAGVDNWEGWDIVMEKLYP